VIVLSECEGFACTAAFHTCETALDGSKQ